LREWASLIEEAMRVFGAPYPRDRAERRERLVAAFADQREGSTPFDELDHRFFAWLHGEEDRWERAADAYASRADT